MDSPQRILERYWGYDSFRPQQLEIIRSVLEGNDTVALLPTGGGKSICYQVPGLLRGGLCLVVTPLIALMNDQVTGLQDRGIKAMALTGHLPTDRLVELLDNARYGGYQFLYLSPERIQNELVQEAIRQMDINLIAIDEAHCISQWGHDFRPAYRGLNILKELQPKIPILALTATATLKVLEDTIFELKLMNPGIFQASFARPNLAMNVKEVQDKKYHLLKLLQDEEQWAIVYVRSRQQTVEYAHWLSNQGIPALSYHGGIPEEEKKTRLASWKQGIQTVMVATNAFGMGIDHNRVRKVIHLQLPESLESYYQEVGRAGRDGEFATASLLWNQADKVQAQRQFIDDLPTIKELKKLYRRLSNYFQISYGEGLFEAFRFQFETFCDTYDLKRSKTYVALQTLDRMGIIQLSQQFGSQTQMRFLVPSKVLLAHFDTRMDHSIVGRTILRQYSGIFDDRKKVSIRRVSRQTGLSTKKIMTALNEMAQLDLLELETQQTDAAITFLVPREDDRTLNPMARDLEALNAHKRMLLQTVFQFLDEKLLCRSLQILDYFGQAGGTACGICSNCYEKKKQSSQDQEVIAQTILDLLKDSTMDSRSLIEKLTFDPQECLAVLQLLMDTGHVKITANKKFYLV